MHFAQAVRAMKVLAVIDLSNKRLGSANRNDRLLGANVF